MKTKLHLLSEPMMFKDQIKIEELLTKLRVIRDVHKYHNKLAVSRKYHMHRNTVHNLIKDFETKIEINIQKQLLINHNLSKDKIEKLLSPLISQSRKPASNSRSANKKQENLILDYFKKRGLRSGYKRMYRMINIKRSITGIEKKKDLQEIKILQNLTLSQLRGIYKRHNLKVKKIRTANRERRPLYDYNALACFEKCHYDTKSILDKHALPQDIYDKFKLQKDLPIIEWNIIDAKSRTRFIAYSHNRTSEFGLHFLLFVILYLRAKNIISWNIAIEIGTDNGSEFFSGSKIKMREWNNILKLLNAKIYSYSPGFDIRKNLIERSHKTDDEEFFIPRGNLINSKKDFLIEADHYVKYFNGQRSHSGIDMNDMVPIKKMESCGIYNAQEILNFPTMILEENIKHIKKATEIVRLYSVLEEFRAKNNSHNFDQKVLIKIKNQFMRFSKSAQNVLTYYP